MTTSGLYGTVVARNDDETVTLSIAPGVEVKWAFAALRDVDAPARPVPPRRLGRRVGRRRHAGLPTHPLHQGVRPGLAQGRPEHLTRTGPPES